MAIVIGVFAHCIRNIIMSYTSNYYIMLFVQILHTLDFALFWSAMMEYVHMVSPSKIVTTMIMLLQSLHFGFSPFIINIVGGIICENYNGQILFRGTGVLCGVWGVLLTIYFGVRHFNNENNDSTSLYIDTTQSMKIDVNGNPDGNMEENYMENELLKETI